VISKEAGPDDTGVPSEPYAAIKWVTTKLRFLDHMLNEADRSTHSTAMEIAHHLLSLSIDDLEKEAMGELEKEFDLSEA